MAFPSPDNWFPTTVNSTGGAATSGSTAATSHAVVLPTPIVAGQLLMMFGRFAANPSAPTATGWTFVESQADASDDTTFWGLKDTLADGTEDGTSVTVNHGSAKLVAVTVAISGAEDPTVQFPQHSGAAVGTGANPDCPNVTGMTGAPKDFLFIVAAGLDGELNDVTTPPTNYTSPAAVQGNDTGVAGAVGTNCSLSVGTRQLNASSENPGTFASGTASSGWCAFTIAVHPGAAAAATAFPFQSRAHPSRYPQLRR